MNVKNGLVMALAVAAAPSLASPCGDLAAYRVDPVSFFGAPLEESVTRLIGKAPVQVSIIGSAEDARVRADNISGPLDLVLNKLAKRLAFTYAYDAEACSLKIRMEPRLPVPNKTAADDAMASDKSPEPTLTKSPEKQPEKKAKGKLLKAEASAGSEQKLPVVVKGDSKPNTVSDAGVSAVASVPVWTLLTSDKTVRVALTRWGRDAGWNVAWEANFDYPIPQDSAFYGGFEESIEAVATSLARADKPIQAVFYEGNRVIRIVPLGKKGIRQ